MKKNLSTILFAIVCGMLVASCGNSGGSGKKLATNEVLGDLPNLVYQHNYQDSVFKAKADEEQKGLKFDESGLKAAMEIEKKYDTKREEANTKFAADVEKLNSSLAGKAIPYEMEAGLPYEITNCKIVDLDKNGNAHYEIELKITDAKAIKPNWNNEYYVIANSLDKDGNEIEGAGVGCTFVIPKAEDGATFTGKSWIGFSKPEKYVNFAKFKFVNKK